VGHCRELLVLAEEGRGDCWDGVVDGQHSLVVEFALPEVAGLDKVGHFLIYAP
jgi:hypothetical protein